MDRLNTNRQILLKLNGFIEDNPQLRFIQALWGLKLIDADCDERIIDRFNEESEETLYRIDKGSIDLDNSLPCSDSDHELFICNCNNTEHQLIFSWIPGYGEMYMTTHLCPDTFWKRVKNGIKYIFGHRSKYGDFDEFIFKSEDANKLQRIVNYLKSY